MLTGRRSRVRALAILFPVLVSFGCGVQQEEGRHEEGHSEHGQQEAEVSRGPHGGRLFEGGDVDLELWIAEEGIPPEFRAQLTDARGRVLDPGPDRLWVILDRFGGRRDSVGLRAEGDRFRSVIPVSEPHSFDAHIFLERENGRIEWQYEQREGRVELVAEAVAAGEIEVGTAGRARIEVRAEAPGEVRLNAERVVQVRPRFSGIVRKLERQLGDAVSTGDLLAVIHGDESLADFEIRASMPGTVVHRAAAPGEAVDRESILYTIADLSTVWVDLALYPQNVSRVNLGQEVVIRGNSGGPLSARGRIRYVGPLLEQDTRISFARIVLTNVGRRWKPGLYVTGEIVVEDADVEVAVPEAAIVRAGSGSAVFRADGTSFELQPVTTGRTDGVTTEILEGLEPGARIAIRNAFLLKAELGKAGATHDH